MSLLTGARVGPYEIVALIGAGGMGEVYRARDTRLDRTVAVKLLTVVADSDLGQRFEREARAISSLNHPHICTLYDVGTTATETGQTVDYLVLEHLEGQTLADRIAAAKTRPGLALDEALPIARQIASALAAAHEKGIVHRDLKPANIMLTRTGVKVLDFGLAKLVTVTDEAPAVDATATGALTIAGATHPGMILGTCAYMSPEQARGQTVDRRADVWAFGCLLFEVLTGQPAFAGPTTSDTLAAVLDREPDYGALPPDTPGWVRRLLRFCLTKDAALRLQDIRDAGFQLPPEPPDVSLHPPPTPAAGTRVRLVAVAVAALLAGVAMGLGASRLADATPPAPADASVVRFVMALPQGHALRGNAQRIVAISSDGRQMAYVTVRPEARIYLRQLNGVDATPVAGTEGGTSPFFSPDGAWLGFWKDRQLFKVALQGGGAPIALCAARRIYGASWGDNDRIVFGQAHAGIFEVSAAGGEPQLLVAPDTDAGEIAFEGPRLLPGGRALLFTVLHEGHNWDGASIVVHDLMNGARRVLVQGGTDARYLTSGHLLFLRGLSLYALRIDPDVLTVTGSPIPVQQDVWRSLMWESGAGQFDVSQNGTLVHVPGSARQNIATLVWVDRNGAEEVIPVQERSYYHVRLSPDGLRIVADTLVEQDLWVYEIGRNAMSRLTSTQTNLHPVWTFDGRSVIFDAALGLALDRSPLDGSAPPQRVAFDYPRHLTAVSASPDGRTLAVEQSDDFSAFDIAVIDLDGQRPVRPLQASPEFREMSPVFSRDGRWLAYVSDETGRNEVYVRPYPSLSERWLVSNGGGTEPTWSRDGRELFYRTGQGASTMMAVAVETAGAFRAGQPRQLFAKAPGTYIAEGIGAHPVYDVSADGKRFLMVRNLGGQPRTTINVALNWFEELTRLVPASAAR